MSHYCSNNKDSARDIQHHYNSIPQVAFQHRQHSQIICVRKFNNWLKAVLIQKFAFENCTILDLCCGKGGDLQKFLKANAKCVVGVDIANVSIEQAQERYDSLPNKNKPRCHFFPADCCTARLTSMYRDPKPSFDLTSCQFALHYAFESEEKIRRLLLNATECLKVGGHFVLTTTDACRIVKTLRARKQNHFGNDVYRVQYDEEASSISNVPIFGAKYAFTLAEAVENLSEYLVHPDVLISLCEEYGLKLILYERFHEFYQRNIQDVVYWELFQKMRVLGPGEVIDPQQWEVIGYYTVFAFEKLTNKSPAENEN